MTLLAQPQHLAALLSGQPGLLVAEDLPGGEALAVPGLTLWRLRASEAGWLALPAASEAADMEGAEAVPLPPGGILAVLAADAAPLAPLAAWWEAAADRPLPLIAAATATEALPALLGRLLQELATAQSRAVQLERSLVETRIDYEESRAVIARATRQLGHRAPTPPSLALALEPAAESLEPGPQGRLALRQPLGRKAEGLAALGLHLAVLPPGAPGRLRARVLAAESGRILGSWLLPLAAAAPGWLVLDWPTPCGPLRETALLELVLEGAAPEGFALSLDQGWVPEAAACVAEGLAAPAPPDRALALRLWVGESGSRFVTPDFWDWTEAGGSLPLQGVPLSLPRLEWDAARRLAGDWARLAIDQQGSRFIGALRGRDSLGLLFPRISPQGAGLLRVTWRVCGGQLAPFRLAAWLLPPAVTVTGPEDLAGASAFSGWRLAGEAQEASLTLALPEREEAWLQLALLAEGLEPGTALKLELAGITLEAGPEPAPRLRPPPMQGAAPPPASPLPRLEDGGDLTALLGAVTIHQDFVSPQGHRHLDLELAMLVGHGGHWPGLRFKLGVNRRDEVLLEFRRGKGWPEAFVTWPGTEVDQFGPVLQLKRRHLPDFLAGLAEPRDRAMMLTLLALLEDVVRVVAAQAGFDAELVAFWQQRVERLRLEEAAAP